MNKITKLSLITGLLVSVGCQTYRTNERETLFDEKGKHEFVTEYEIKRSPKLANCLVTPVAYPLAIVATSGFGLLFDIYSTFSGKPRDTIFHGMIYGNDFGTENFSNTSHGNESRRIISRGVVEEQVDQLNIQNSPAINLEELLYILGPK